MPNDTEVDREYGLAIERWDFSEGETYYNAKLREWTNATDVTRITIYHERGLAEEVMETWKAQLPVYSYKLISVQRTTTMEFNYDCEVD